MIFTAETRRIGGITSAILAVFALLAALSDGCEKSLNRALEEEKSYSRAAMEKYRQDPTVSQVSHAVLESWSRMDYVAVTVAQRRLDGEWVSAADKLHFLEPKIQHDTDEKPYCVIQRKDEIIVLRIFHESLSCSREALPPIETGNIRSGDMEFSGRTNYWIYVLRNR
jgi:hypothetical protein